jgi:hypothetical protein
MTEQVERTASGHISWTSCLIGLILGEAILLILSNAALDLSNYAFGATTNIDGGIVGTSSLLAVLAGAFIAARRAGQFGLFQGITVAIGFIIVGALFQFLQETSITAASLRSGSHTLVDLGSMNMGGLISGDFLALFGGTFGGLLARRP